MGLVQVAWARTLLQTQSPLNDSEEPPDQDQPNWDVIIALCSLLVAICACMLFACGIQIIPRRKEVTDTVSAIRRKNELYQEQFKSKQVISQPATLASVLDGTHKEYEKYLAKYKVHGPIGPNLPGLTGERATKLLQKWEDSRDTAMCKLADKQTPSELNNQVRKLRSEGIQWIMENLRKAQDVDTKIEKELIAMKSLAQELKSAQDAYLAEADRLHNTQTKSTQSPEQDDDGEVTEDEETSEDEGDDHNEILQHGDAGGLISEVVGGEF